MDISRTYLTTIGLLVLATTLCFTFRTPESSIVVPQSTSSGLISDLANPFGSGNSNKTLFDTTPTQPTWETSSGARIFFNTNWIGRTVDIQGKSIHYQFGSGNPVETDRTSAEMLSSLKKCELVLPYQENCRDILGNAGQYLHKIDPMDDTEASSHIPRMTPEIEYLVYSFLSNPIVRQSAESCGSFFWKDGNEGASLYPHEDMGEVNPENWWKPYRIDINDLIMIHPSTGRKELVIDKIWTLNTQLQIPSIKDGGINYTNTKLRECLQKNNQLNLLQSHVASHYERLHQLWSGQ
jgi:hypothetical protein